jgi:hypothetical protein
VQAQSVKQLGHDHRQLNGHIVVWLLLLMHPPWKPVKDFTLKLLVPTAPNIANYSMAFAQAFGGVNLPPQ